MQQGACDEFRLLHDRQVPAVRHLHERRTLDAICNLFGEVRRRGGVLRADEHERRAIDPGEMRPGVRPLADGRLLTGMIVERTANRLTLQTATQRIDLAKEDVEEIRDSPLSMMPEGQLDPLTREQLREIASR